MDEKPVLTEEEKGAAVLKLVYTLLAIDGVTLVLLVIIPIVIIGPDLYVKKSFFYLLPFVIVSIITGIWFHYHLKKLRES